MQPPHVTQFGNHGFLVTPPLIDGEACDAIAHVLINVAVELAGARNVLQLPWCANLATQLRTHPLLATLLPIDAVAVQCTLFEKSVDRNWLVPVHQDLSIPVAEKIEHSELMGWSTKEGVLHVQPPSVVSEQLIAVRLHIDECTLNDGPLAVVPRSHCHGRLSPDEIVAMRVQNGEVQCPVSRGATLVMHPLLVHASSKASGQGMRRVLHFLFGPRVLPFGLKWHHVV